MKLRLLALAFSLILAPLVSLVTPSSAAAYSNSRLIDDSVFDNVGTMNEAQIQSFLAGKGPCLANYQDIDFNWNGSTWSYGGSIPASRVIYKAAQMWGLNPQVIIATLQKEESLITGTSCDGWRYNSAMGYGCPDSGGCNPKYVGFSRQVLWGSWQLKFNKERSEGNVAWDGDGDISYVGYMTQGSYKRCNNCAVIANSGYATIDGQSIYLENGATASLYTYTPHLGQSFPGIFESWFGSTFSDPNGVFRMANYISHERLFTASAVERDTIKNKGGWVYEGVAFHTYPEDSVPVYRMANYITHERLFTTSAVERDTINGRGGWVAEGVAFQASLNGAYPVYRMANYITHERLFTTSAVERDTINGRGGWVAEGVAFTIQN